MDGLEELKNSLAEVRRSLLEKQNERQQYLDKATAISAVYTRMKHDKTAMSDQKKQVRSFAKERMDTFQGNLYQTVYCPAMDELVDSYGVVVTNIDSNLDELNRVRASYENKAYQCEGPIGYLRSAVNSLVHEIENWVN